MAFYFSTQIFHSNTSHVTQLSINNAIELRNNVNFLNRNITVFCEKLRGLNNITLRRISLSKWLVAILSIILSSGALKLQVAQYNTRQFSILRTCKRKKLSKLDIEFLHLFGIFFRDQY